MPVIELATLKNYDPASHRATIQLAGSVTTYLDSIPVSLAIPASALATGNRVLLAIPGGNVRDAVIIASWPQGEAAAAETHASRHQLLGPDRLSALTNILNLQIYICDWSTRDAWTDYVTGSGQVLWESILQMSPETGATSGSIAALYTGIAGGFSPQSDGRALAARIQSATDLSDCEIWLVATKGPGNQFPQPGVYNHIGWRIINGEIQAIASDGQSYTQVDTGSSIASQWQAAHLLILGHGSSADFYVNRELKATITSNLPSPWNFRCWAGIRNSAPITRKFRITFISWGVEC